MNNLYFIKPYTPSVKKLHSIEKNIDFKRSLIISRFTYLATNKNVKSVFKLLNFIFFPKKLQRIIALSYFSPKAEHLFFNNILVFCICFI